MDERTRRFETATLPHLDAAYNLARWLLRDDQQAQDAVQEAYLRALRFFDDLRGASARPWLLSIVRNACHDAQRQRQARGTELELDPFDGALDAPHGSLLAEPAQACDPALLWEQRALGLRVDAAIAALPPLFREVIVLRELQELSYHDIARVAGIAPGTVMSRLSRARALLRDALQADAAAVPNERKHDAKA